MVLNFRKGRKLHGRVGRRLFYYGLFLLCCGLSINFAKLTTYAENVNSEYLSILEQGQKLYVESRKMFYNSESSTIEAKSKLVESEAILNQLPDGFEKCFWRAKVEFTFGRIAVFADNKNEAQERFNVSISFLKKAIDYNKKNSEAYRLLADSYSGLVSIKPISGISYGPQILKLLNTAISLDKNNYTAYASLGVYYFSAPKIGGGSTTKAVKLLKKALESKDEFDNFITYIFLGMTYSKQKKASEASASFNKALEIYPGSLWAQSLLQELERK